MRHSRRSLCEWTRWVGDGQMVSGTGRWVVFAVFILVVLVALLQR